MDESKVGSITVWISKHAISCGVVKAKAVRLSQEMGYSAGYVKVTDGEHMYMVLGPSDWHDTEAAAIAKANKMKSTRLASLRKQIDKLTALTFEPSSGK